jgi:hypothetical protein
MAGTLTATTIQNDTSSPPTFRNNTVEIGTLCRAWVNFNGTGTVAIRASFNVSSITDNGTGDYTVNFTTAMPDANYAALATTGRAQGGSAIIAFGPETSVPTTTAWRFSTISSGISGTDAATAYVAIFR